MYSFMHGENLGAVLNIIFKLFYIFEHGALNNVWESDPKMRTEAFKFKLWVLNQFLNHLDVQVIISFAIIFWKFSSEPKILFLFPAVIN